MPLKLVEVMDQPPGSCLACGTTPTERGKPQPAIDLGVDVNWGDTAYLCHECTSLICDLLDRPSELEVKKARKESKELVKENTELTARVEELESDLETLEKAAEVKKRRAG